VPLDYAIPAFTGTVIAEMLWRAASAGEIRAEGYVDLVCVGTEVIAAGAGPGHWSFFARYVASHQHRHLTLAGGRSFQFSYRG
jgi:hypothetical protein